jgi:hypothetical protein
VAAPPATSAPPGFIVCSRKVEHKNLQRCDLEISCVENGEGLAESALNCVGDEFRPTCLTYVDFEKDISNELRTNEYD